MKRSLAIFDFDGTLTSSDSLLAFIRFYGGDTKFLVGMLRLLPSLLMMKFGIRPNWKTKEEVMEYFWKGELIDAFNTQGRKFAKERLPGLLNPKAMERLQFHVDRGDRVLIVTASAENWISAWTETTDVELIATKLELESGAITGKIHGLNCYGQEKVRRIKEIVNPAEYDKVYVYGDSRGDKEILEMATDPFYRAF